MLYQLSQRAANHRNVHGACNNDKIYHVYCVFSVTLWAATDHLTLPLLNSVNLKIWKLITNTVKVLWTLYFDGKLESGILYVSEPSETLWHHVISKNPNFPPTESSAPYRHLKNSSCSWVIICIIYTILRQVWSKLGMSWKSSKKWTDISCVWQLLLHFGPFADVLLCMQYVRRFTW